MMPGMINAVGSSPQIPPAAPPAVDRPRTVTMIDIRNNLPNCMAVVKMLHSSAADEIPGQIIMMQTQSKLCHDEANALGKHILVATNRIPTCGKIFQTLSSYDTNTLLSQVGYLKDMADTCVEQIQNEFH